MEETRSGENSPPPTNSPLPALGVRQSVPSTTEPVDMAASRNQRQQELMAAKLADPDPKNAVLGSAAIEALDINALLKTEMLKAMANLSDPRQRLETLMSGMRLYGSTLKLAEKLV